MTTRLLILEDNPVDAELAQALLREADLGFAAKVVDTRDAYERALHEDTFDLILADFSLPMFDGMSALAIAREAVPDVPFIFVSATLGEEIAIESLKNGATDYVLKQRLERLVPAVRRALRESEQRAERAELRRQREQLIERLQRQAARLTDLADASIAIASATSLEGVLRMLTAQARTLIHAGQSVTCLLDPASGAYVVRARSTSDGVHEISEADVQRHCGGALAARGRRVDGEVLVVPLTERDETIVGNIVILDKIDGDFSDEDEAVLVQLAQMASAAIQNARLYTEAQAANRAKDDFLATLAHELRTPVTAILGWVQMLGEGHLDEGTSAAARHMIENSARVQAQIIDDLMDVSRIIAGKLSLSARPVELAPLLEDAAQTFRGPAAQNDVTLAAEIDPLPISVWGDPTRIQQIVWNLLSNAIKFTPPGGTITLRLERDQDFAKVTIRDTGDGIDPAFLPLVFERYRQQDSGSTTRQHGGLGLGLAIVRHLVTMQGGDVHAHSDGHGKGAQFTIRLPVMAVVRSGETLPDSVPSLAGVRIVLVEDEEPARTALSDLLREYGAEVRDVGTVSDALKVVREFNPHIIVSDIAMPGEDGYALIRRLRDLEPELGRGIPALAVTAYGRPDVRVRILSSGFRRYVQKPIDAAHLAREIADEVGPDESN